MLGFNILSLPYHIRVEEPLGYRVFVRPPGCDVVESTEKYSESIGWRMESGCLGVDTTAGRLGLRTCLRGSLQEFRKGTLLFLQARAHFFGSECLCRVVTLVFVRVSQRGERMFYVLGVVVERVKNDDGDDCPIWQPKIPLSTSRERTHVDYNCATGKRRSIHMSHSDKQSKRKMNGRT